MEKKTVYTLVDVKDRLPDKQQSKIFTIQNGHPEATAFDGQHFYDSFRLTHWLEKQTDVFIFTEKELEKRDREVAAKSFDAAREYVWPSNVAPSNVNLEFRKYKTSKEQYLNNLTTNQ